MIYSYLLLFDFYPLANSKEHHEEILTRPHSISITITEIIVIRNRIVIVQVLLLLEKSEDTKRGLNC